MNWGVLFVGVFIINGLLLIGSILGLLLKNLNKVTTIQKPHYLLHIPAMVTSTKFLDSNQATGALQNTPSNWDLYSPY